MRSRVRKFCKAILFQRIELPFTLHKQGGEDSYQPWEIIVNHVRMWEVCLKELYMLYYTSD